MKELIDYIATALVDQPGAVQVNEKEQEDLVLVELTVAKEDLGKVIGKQGRTARAMRSLLAATAAGRAGNKRTRLEIME
ncbi:MAG: KH domain-containing protein [Desulfobacterales bacterium]|nr:KH domain-containing protein [Desulfobacterales bacterium]